MTEDNKLKNACLEYLLRKARKSFPQGHFERGNKWFPDLPLPCCYKIRPPSWAYPYSLYRHCLTLEHVANEYGVDVKELRRYVREHGEEVLNEWRRY